MAYCSNCGSEISADAKTCPSCGAIIGASAINVVNTYDHTTDFDAQDISDNKVYAMMAYLLDFIGIIIALMVAKESPYAKFHAKEAAKLTIVSYIVVFFTAVLAWTCIVPFAGCILAGILFVLKVIAFVQVCKGKAVEPWLIRSLKFLQ